MRLLILEDDLKDLLMAANAAQSVGFTVVEAFTSLGPARAFFNLGLRGEGPLPDAILLDLCLERESGYEVLRAWHSARAQSRVRMIVWTRLEDRNRAIEKLFKIDAYVSKWDGASAVHEALRRIAPAAVN